MHFCREHEEEIFENAFVSGGFPPVEGAFFPTAFAVLLIIWEELVDNCSCNFKLLCVCMCARV